ncbi:hypothetical protein LCGC14_1359120 [marine sediment metagenome]|uniref:Uncharacterized protein n=1 Tax=marine sediment metagenome TaxID=412755 RepID=A0A0F9NAW8_9ZZZZ
MEHTPRYFLTELNDGLQWLTDGHDFGMHPGAARELLKALEDVRRIVANQLDNGLFPAKGDTSNLTPEQAHVRERLSMASRIARNAIKAAKGDA